MCNTQHAYPAKFVKETNGSYSVYFPDINGCQTYDDTLEGAIIMAKQALKSFLTVLIEDDEPLPPPSNYSDIDCNGCCVRMVVANLEREV